MYGNGNHNMSVGDVDGDGCDEIVWGSATLDHDGKMLSATGYGHGDAIHLADHNPDRPGLELFEIHEGSPYGWDLHDAATGEILFSATGGSDNGRGVAGNFYEGHRGSTFLSANDRQHRSAVTGKVVRNAATSMNFRIYWDDDPYEELLDGGTITKLTSSGITEIKIKGKSPYAYNNSSSCNGSKSTPNIVADLFGDWREELILWNSANSSTLNIFTSDIQTSYAAPTLMHDHLYRMGVAWQNVAYNQPPHLGYYLPDRFKPVFNFVGESPAEQTVTLGDSIAPVKVAYRYTTYATVDSTFTPQAREKGLSDCFKRTNDLRDKTILIEGCPDQTGDYVVLFRMGGTASLPEKIYQQAIIHVVPPASIEGVHTADGAPRSDTPVHDLQGRRVGTYSTLSDRQLPKGIYIVGQKKYIVK
jgi:rhamnogalacturonan endolyase